MLTNPYFYLAWAAMAIFPLMFAFLTPKTWGGKIITIIIALAIAFGLATLIYKEAEGNRNRWNNGIHIDCGGEYQFSGATQWRSSKTYYYTCDKCGHTEEFSALMG